ncbi:MAG: biopolymer transporter ExbD [Bacteroidetes bacterium]|nr:biopolymer transporter ExbD [Bacteroidota bacterium]
MSDVVFTLLLFFMVSTVIKKFTGLVVEIPEAYKVEKLHTKTHTSYIWIDAVENISFDDYQISSLDEVYQIARDKIERDVQLLIFLRVDRNMKMGVLSDVQQELRKAGALRIVYGTKTKATPN